MTGVSPNDAKQMTRGIPYLLPAVGCLLPAALGSPASYGVKVDLVEGKKAENDE
jgi:hypothetical protein